LEGGKEVKNRLVKNAKHQNDSKLGLVRFWFRLGQEGYSMLDVIFLINSKDSCGS